MVYLTPLFATLPLFSSWVGGVPEVAPAFTAEIKKRAEGKESSLLMMPSYVTIPRNHQISLHAPIYYALDVGGTNLRVLKISFADGLDSPQVIASHRCKIPQEIICSRSCSRLFDLLGQETAFFLKEMGDSDKELSLGFTFSFAFEQKSLDEASIVRWSKGFSFEDGIGKDPVAMFRAALKKYDVEKVKVAALINDTTGTLLSRISLAEADVGLIVGTGMNICLLMPDEKNNEMIYVLEAGNFDMALTSLMTEYDIAVDESSENPGRHRAEKMISGKYLGKVVSAVLKEHAEKIEGDVEITTPEVCAFTEIDDEVLMERCREHNIIVEDLATAQAVRGLCRNVVTRSAYIVAACLQASVAYIDPGSIREHVVVVDGALYNNPWYSARVREAFDVLEVKNITLTPAQDGSGIGAAIAAAIAG
jgi:hexokinase